MLVVERRPPEDIDRHVGGGLGERDLAGGWAGGERFGSGRARPGGNPRTDVRKAGASLARAQAGPARPLEQLEIGEPGIPRGGEIVDRRAHARTDHARGGSRGKPMVVGGRSDGGDAGIAGHSSEDVSWGPTQIDVCRFARRRRLGTIDANGDDGGDASRRVALEPDRGSGETDDAPEIDIGLDQPLGGASRDDPGEIAARTHRVDVGGAGRNDDLVRLDVEHAGRLARNDRGSWVDPDDLDAV